MTDLDRCVTAPGGRKNDDGSWSRVMVECGEWEARCRWAYDAAGWPAYGWAYENMPKWLAPGWHHDGPATHVIQAPEEKHGE